MDKMILMPAEEYKVMKKMGAEEEASDVKLAKFQDSFIRKQDAKRIEDDQNWQRLSSRLKPIFSTQREDIQEMLKPFPSRQREEAKLVLNLLARLPKVTLSKEQLLVDGQPMRDSLLTIVRDIMRNDVRGVESLIQALRRGPGRTIPPPLAMETIDVEDSPSLYKTVVSNSKGRSTLVHDDDDDDDDDDDVTMESLIPCTPLLLQAEELPPSSSTPRRVTPIKTTPKKLPTPKELKAIAATTASTAATTATTTKTPKVQRTPVGPVPRVQRTPIKTRSKVQRSPISIETTDDPPTKQSAKKQETYWINY